MINKEKFITHTKKWIIDVVVGCNFCPFAAHEVKKNSIFFEVIEGNQADVLKVLKESLEKMDDEPAIETMFLIIPESFQSFDTYLDLVDAAERQLKKQGYEGIYQVASFHPDYVFSGSEPNDAANYTNRSPYPMLHILREESVSRVIDGHPDTLQIPLKNVAFARGKGIEYMQRLRAACMDHE